VAQHPGKNDRDPVQSRYAPNKEPAQAAVEGDFIISEDAAHRALERRAVDVHEPCVFSHDANGHRQELERLAANIRAAQLACVPGLDSRRKRANYFRNLGYAPT
jgi:hypothetical protein